MARRSKKRAAGKRAARKPTPTRRPQAQPAPEGPEAAVRTSAAKPRLPLGKRLLFHLVTVVLFFGLAELVLALVGIRPLVVDEDPYVGFSSRLRLFEPAGDGDQLRTAANKLALFNDQRFARAKPRGTSRIFTLGGSCTYGRPFDDATSWTGWLRTYLDAVDSGRWEVINAGGISYASYRVATLMEELVDYDPDLFIIYSGHNEFLERRTYADLIAEPEPLTRTKLLLQRSRLWALGRKLATAGRRRAQRRYEMTGEVEELLDSSAGLDYYFRDEPFQRQVLDHYRFNLRRMIDLARAGGARVVLVTIPVNEKDFPPFKSQHRDGLSEADRARHAQQLDEAAAALDVGAAERARALAAEAVGLDPRFAAGHFLLGQALTALGRHDEAGRSFARAIAEDVCPLRALDETNDLISVTARRAEVPLVDYRRLLKDEMRARAGHPNLGDELFYDHAHPTVEANGILARALVDQMAAMGLLELGDDWHQGIGDRVRSEVLARVDAEAQARAYKNLSKLLIWAGKKREADKYVRLAAEVLGDDWELHYNAGVVAFGEGRYETAVTSLREAARLNPEAGAVHDVLAQVLGRLGRLDEAIAAGRRAVAAEPERAAAWNNLGTLYGAQGDHARALEATREALRIAPELAEAHNNLGKVYFDTGELEAALRSYERAMALRPHYHEAMTNRGLVLGELGRYQEALDVFSAVLEAEPRLAAAHLGRAKALLGLGNGTAASASLATVIELDPHYVEAWELLAHTRLAAGQADRAQEAVDRGLASNPEAARLHHLNGRLLAREGRYDEAAAAFATAIAGDPELLAAHIDLGNLRMAQRRTEEAIGIYREALDRHPDDDRIHHVLATALRITGRIEEARSHLERAVELWPTNAAVVHDLAAVCEELGQRERALELYRRAAELDPELEAARTGAARLSGRPER